MRKLLFIFSIILPWYLQFLRFGYIKFDDAFALITACSVFMCGLIIIVSIVVKEK